MNMPSTDEGAPRIPIRRAHPVRDNIEGILATLVLALIIRHFVFEVFKIPTCSMAPTLLGQHRDLTCPNCGLDFAVDAAQNDRGVINVVDAVCPNCGYDLSTEQVSRTVCRCFPSWPQRLFRRGGNRVLVHKMSWRLDPPGRWDVIVFRHPLLETQCRACGTKIDGLTGEEKDFRCPSCGSADLRKSRKNLIKRLIGLPTEEIVIWHGDIFANGSLQRKPPGVQDELWQLVHDSAYAPRRPVDSRGPTWVEEKGSLRQESATIRLTPGEDGTAGMRYAPRILDFTAYNGRLADVPVPVGDLRWDVAVKLDGPGALRLSLREDDVEYVAIVRFGGAAQKTAIEVAGKLVSESDFSADVSAEHRVAFSNADDRLELRVDGRPLLKHEHVIPLAQLPEQAWRSGAGLAVHSAEATFSRIRLERDVYYLPRPGHEPRYAVPQDSYFMLGDNVRKSGDSRYWGPHYLAKGNVIGRAAVICWPPGHLRPIP